MGKKIQKKATKSYFNLQGTAGQIEILCLYYGFIYNPSPAFADANEVTVIFSIRNVT
jgi:hypothetical protein